MFCRCRWPLCLLPTALALVPQVQLLGYVKDGGPKKAREHKDHSIKEFPEFAFQGPHTAKGSIRLRARSGNNHQLRALWKR